MGVYIAKTLQEEKSKRLIEIETSIAVTFNQSLIE